MIEILLTSFSTIAIDFAFSKNCRVLWRVDSYVSLENVERCNRNRRNLIFFFIAFGSSHSYKHVIKLDNSLRRLSRYLWYQERYEYLCHSCRLHPFEELQFHDGIREGYGARKPVVPASHLADLAALHQLERICPRRAAQLTPVTPQQRLRCSSGLDSRLSLCRRGVQV